MSNITPKPSGTDAIKAKLIAHLYSTYGEVKPGSIDTLLALIQADRERLYGELVAALPPEIDIASRQKFYQIKDTAGNNEGLQQRWYDHGQTDTAKRTKAAINTVFNREGAV